MWLIYTHRFCYREMPKMITRMPPKDKLIEVCKETISKYMTEGGCTEDMIMREKAPFDRFINGDMKDFTAAQTFLVIYRTYKELHTGVIARMAEFFNHTDLNFLMQMTLMNAIVNKNTCYGISTLFDPPRSNKECLEILSIFVIKTSKSLSNKEQGFVSRAIFPDSEAPKNTASDFHGLRI